MDVRQEINNHLDWMESIASLLDSDELTPEELQTITEHDKCKLGIWMNSEDADSYKNMPDYENLRESHDAFHELAGKLIVTLKQNNEKEAIEIGIQFIETSKKVIGYLKSLQNHAG